MLIYLASLLLLLSTVEVQCRTPCFDNSLFADEAAVIGYIVNRADSNSNGFVTQKETAAFIYSIIQTPLTPTRPLTWIVAPIYNLFMEALFTLPTSWLLFLGDYFEPYINGDTLAREWSQEIGDSRAFSDAFFDQFDSNGNDRWDWDEIMAIYAQMGDRSTTQSSQLTLQEYAQFWDEDVYNSSPCPP